MDSLTQIVLGAAVGEVVLGKKVGNKAMLWGAIAGTIPDLDVYQSLFFDSLRANELHRGLSHSLLFSIAVAPVLGWLIKHKEKWTLASLLTLILLYPLISLGNIAVQLILGTIIGILTYLTFKYNKSNTSITVKDWTKLAFWSLVTHPILDCHTTWGTQFLWPLPHKLAWNNIFVLDPLYTVPFLVFVTIAMFYHRESKKRKVLNWLGITVSSIYMLWSLGAKWYTYQVFEKSLAAQELAYSRLTTVPTPFNTFLWSATADGDSFYYNGLYSIFDSDREVEFTHIETNHHVLNQFSDSQILDRLKFISKDWYVVRADSDAVTFNDARYGPMYTTEGKPNYGFGYRLKEMNGKLEVTQPEPGEEDMQEMGEVMTNLWNRIWGE